MWNLLAYRRRLADPRFTEFRAELREKMSHLYKRQARFFRDRREFIHAMRAYAGGLAANLRDGESWRGLLASAMRRS